MLNAVVVRNPFEHLCSVVVEYRDWFKLPEPVVVGRYLHLSVMNAVLE